MNGATKTAFIDVLFSMLIAVFCLFVLAFVSMNPVAEASKGVAAKAEFVIEMTWPDGSLDDVDLWLLLPDGRKVGFNRKDAGIATLDRDDRGAQGDVFHDGDEPKLIRVNREVIAVRGIMPGRYTVNAHYYAGFDEAKLGFKDEWGQPHIPLKVKLTKVNPRVVESGASEVVLRTVGEQVTAFAFEIDGRGEVTAFHASVDLPFVEATQ
jgi:hypothetical protein